MGPGVATRGSWILSLLSGYLPEHVPRPAADDTPVLKLLLAGGGTGLSHRAFDLQTEMGYDSDHPRALGEVGKVGVAIDSIDDMRVLLSGFPLDIVMELLAH